MVAVWRELSCCPLPYLNPQLRATLTGIITHQRRAPTRLLAARTRNAVQNRFQACNSQPRILAIRFHALAQILELVQPFAIGRPAAAEDIADLIHRAEFAGIRRKGASPSPLKYLKQKSKVKMRGGPARI